MPAVVGPKDGASSFEGADPAPCRLADYLSQPAADVEDGWWSASTFAKDYRNTENWAGAIGVGVDVDYHDEDGEHVAIPEDVALRLADAAEGGGLPGNIHHNTPRGARIVFTFGEMLEDAELWGRAAQGAVACVEKAVEALGLAARRNGRGQPCAGLEVDRGASTDLARLYFMPRARVGGVERDADVLVIRADPADPVDLALEAPTEPRPAPAPTNGRAVCSTIDEAVTQFNEDHAGEAAEWPRSDATCPACGRPGCFGRDPENALRWACFSQSHEANSSGCGIKGCLAWHGDVLDLHAHARSLTRMEVLREAGYLEQRAQPPASLDRQDHGSGNGRHQVDSHRPLVDLVAEAAEEEVPRILERAAAVVRGQIEHARQEQAAAGAVEAIVEGQAAEIAATRLLGALRGDVVEDDADDVGHVDVYEELARTREGAATVPTGLIDLDRHLIGGGLRAGSLVYVAGRPGQGKTSLLVRILIHAAQEGRRGALWSYEVGRRQLAVNVACLLARVSVKDALEGRLGTEEWERLRVAVETMRELPLRLVDGGLQSVEDIVVRARREKRTRGLAILAVDYLGLIAPPKADSRQLELSAMSRRLKLFARELEIPVVVASQLNRAPELRNDPRPRMSDLRESGALEQDADLILFPYREDQEAPTGVAEIIVGKQRNGPRGTILAAWNGPSMSFDDLDGDAAREYREARDRRRGARGPAPKVTSNQLVDQLRRAGTPMSLSDLRDALGVSERTLRKLLNHDLPDDAPVRRIDTKNRSYLLAFDSTTRWEEHRP